MRPFFFKTRPHLSLLARRRPLQASQTQLCPLSNAISLAVWMCEGPQSVSNSGQVNLPALYTL